MEKNNKLQNKDVQTYAEDMAKVFESNESSGLIKKIIHEEEEEEVKKKKLSPKSRKDQFLMFAGFVFIFLASALLIYLVISKEKIETVPIELQFTPLIFTDKTAFVEIELPKEKMVLNILNNIKITEVKQAGVKGIYLTENKKIIGFSRFLELIEANLTKDKISVFGDNFLIGGYKGDTPDLFILLKIRSFSDVFNEMRAWEAKMFFDLHDFFDIAVNASTKYLLTKDFEDGIIQNKNARILYDDKGKIVLMYIFADDTSIVITNTESATREVMLRLAGSRVKK